MTSEKINSLLEFKTFDSQRDDFFLNDFSTLDSFTKAKILKIFSQKMNFFNSYINRSKVKNQILEELTNEVKAFANISDAQQCVELLPSILFYTSINIDSIDEKVLLIPLKNILFLINNLDLLHNSDLQKILINITKIISLAYSYKEIYTSLQKDKNYKYYQNILGTYVEKMDKIQMLDDKFIDLIIETLPAISFPKLKEKLFHKFEEEIDLKKYDLYINKMLPLEGNSEQFLEDIKKYRLKYGIIPEAICIYVNKFYNNNSILGLCNIDLLKHYLQKNGVTDTCVFLDDSMEIGTEGIAAQNTLVIKKETLSIVMFHEARHVIQFNNMENDKNYVNYNYSLLKDTILSNYLDRAIYNRNHNRYLFEIDADIQGEKEYYHILEQINALSSLEQEKMQKLKETEDFRISMSYFLNVGGYNYEKGILFDDIIQSNLDLLTKYPVLKIEYDIYGKRKSMLNILKAFAEELDNNKRSEEEIIGISNCIFNKFYEVKNIAETIKTLTEYHFQNPVILEIAKKLINELQLLESDNELRNSLG